MTATIPIVRRPKQIIGHSLWKNKVNKAQLYKQSGALGPAGKVCIFAGSKSGVLNDDNGPGNRYNNIKGCGILQDCGEEANG